MTVLRKKCRAAGATVVHSVAHAYSDSVVRAARFGLECQAGKNIGGDTPCELFGASRMHYSAVVVGGGAVGLATALMLGRKGVNSIVLGPAHQAQGTVDRRTAAMFAGSIEILRNIGVWDRIAAVSEPISGIRIIDDAERLFRSPEVTFLASDVGLPVFGYNVPNQALVEALQEELANGGSHARYVETKGVRKVHADSGEAWLETAEGERLSANLIVGADGRNSICRTAAGLAPREWGYPQSAFVTTFSHSRAHNGISTEFHRQAGPLTTVPMPGRTSSLVWVEAPEDAQALKDASDDALRRTLERRLQGLLGDVGDFGPRAVFPLRGLTLPKVADNRIALVGEAAHVIPPIGAQGLNLGLRDGAHLADCLAEAARTGTDLGSFSVLNSYNDRRRTDISTRVTGVDLLNRFLLSSAMLPVHILRGFGLFALKSIGPLRRAAIRQGLQPTHGVASLMQPAND